MGTFLLVVLIIILMLLAAFVGVVVGMFLITFLAAKAVASVAAGKTPPSEMKQLSDTFSRLISQSLYKDFGISEAVVNYDINVELPDGKV